MKIMKQILTVLAVMVAVVMMTACSSDSSSNSGVKAVPSPAFITTWKTDNSGVSGDDQIMISTKGEAGNFTVDWGDGTVEHNLTGDNTHTYGSAGTYIVEIMGDFPRIYFGNTTNYDPEKLLSVDNWGDIEWTTMSEAFSFCSNLQINAKDAPDLSGVTDMSDMFYDASLFNQNIGHWDVSTIENMNAVFMNASAFNQDINDWNTSNVTDMAYMFSGATSFNQPLSNWNMKMVGSTYAMFMNASVFNQEINSWDMGSVNTMVYMFNAAEDFNRNIGDWNTSAVDNMGYMFGGASLFNGNIELWDTSKVTNMEGMLNSASNFSNHDLSIWDVSKVTNHVNFFANVGGGNIEPIWLPAAPTGLIPNKTGVDTAHFTWEDNSINEENFIIEVSFSPTGGAVKTYVSGTNTTSSDVTGLYSGGSTYYYFRIKAVNSTGSSTYDTSSIIIAF